MRFSDVEINQLTKAWFAISLAFAIVWRRPGVDFWLLYLLAALTVGVAFIAHELAHKYVAQRFGCWAEFRSFDLGLILAVVSSFIGMVFVAPGAVVIGGLVTREENGKIAAAGPVTNIIIGIGFLLAGNLLNSMGVGLIPFDWRVFIKFFLQIGFGVNSWLAMFNLIPFGPLDGAKIMRWSSSVWGLLMVVAVVMTFMIQV